MMLNSTQQQSKFEFDLFSVTYSASSWKFHNNSSKTLPVTLLADELTPSHLTRTAAGCLKI